MQIFVSYRRDDSAATARLVHNELGARFGADAVFMDIDDIGYGDDFVQVIDQRLGHSDVVVVIIGPRWADIIEQRLRGDDWVRHEVKQALAQRAAGKLRIVPVLVGDVPWPGPPLPADIAGLQRLAAVAYNERALKAGIAAIVEAVQQEGFEDQARRLRRQQLARAAALAVGLGAFAVGWLALLDSLTLDTRAAGLTMQLAAALGGSRPVAWSGRVLLLGIDAKTESLMGRPFDASWRGEHARVIKNAASGGARSIAFDAVLEDPGGEAGNTQLEQALDAVRAQLPVVFGVQLARDGHALMLERFASRVHQGVACVGAKLSRVRTLPLAVQAPAAAPPAAGTAAAAPPPPLPSLALAAYLAGGTLQPLNEVARTVQAVRQPGPEAVTLAYFAAETVKSRRPECSVIAPGNRVALHLVDPYQLALWRQEPQRLRYEQVLAGEPAALAALQGKTVLVGLMRSKDDDYHPVGAPTGDGPVAGDANRWGVELIASQIDALEQQRSLRPPGAVAEALFNAGAALGGGYLAMALRRRTRAWRAGALALAALGIVLLAALWYRSEQQLINWPYAVLAALAGAWLTTATLNKGR